MKVKIFDENHELDLELENFNSFLSKNNLNQLFDKINQVLSLEEEINENMNKRLNV